MKKVVKLKESDLQRIVKRVLNEGGKFQKFHVRAFNYMDSIKKSDMTYIPGIFKRELSLSDEESKILAFNYKKYSDMGGDYNEYIGEPLYDIDNVNLEHNYSLDDYQLTHRINIDGKKLDGMLSPDRILDDTHIIKLTNNDLTHVDFTGYGKLKTLFAMLIEGNPIRTVNIPSLINFLSGTYPDKKLSRFKMEYIPNENFNEEHVEYIKNNVVNDSLEITITPLSQ